MAITKQAVTLMASTEIPSGLSKTSAVTGASIPCGTYYGGEITYKFTNGSAAPTANCVIVFQVSHNGNDWYDYYIVAGDMVASSVITGAIILDRGVMYVRAISYGNTVNAVTVEAHLQAVTGV